MSERIRIDNIVKIEIDNSGRLHIEPEQTKFTLIYRTATEVHWDNQKRTLYSPEPKDWTYFDWYVHIINVAKTECSVKLQLTDDTEWINMPAELKTKITKAQQ